MKTYLDMLRHVLEEGEVRGDRTGTGTIGVFGYQNRYDLTQGFPAITTKKLFWKGVVAELLWFINGRTNTRFLHDHNVHIWDEWADEYGNLGPVYGEQWRRWPMGGIIKPIDQLANAIDSIKNNPSSRRHIVSAWNVGDLRRMALPPCHLLFQFYVRSGKWLDCHLYQRSADTFLGVPFNVASYALLTHIIARECNLQAGEFVHSFGDLHIYRNHLEQVGLQLAREPHPLPKLQFKTKPWLDYEVEDFSLKGYKCHPAIKAPIAV